MKSNKALKVLLGILATALPVSSQLQAQQTQPASPAPAASGQESDEAVVKMEAVSVTGSNIKRMDQEKVLPVSVINADALNTRNALTPVELLTALPQVTNVPANEATTGGAGQRGDISTVNLRGIGASGTLVLLNGRRLAPHPIGYGGSDFIPNINQLPTQGIDHVDVLRDGASSIYGTDAVAGVINYVMKQDIDGTDVRFRYGAPEHKGGQNVQGTVTYGTPFANGKGHFLASVDYVYRDAIFLRDRDFSNTANNTFRAAAPFNTAGSSFDGTSAAGFFPAFNIGTVSAAGTLTSSNNRWFRPLAGAGSTPGFTNVAPTKATAPEFYLNSNNYNQALPRTNRVNFFTSSTYDINNSITAFTDIGYYHAHTVLQRLPLSWNSPGSEAFTSMSVDNPYNPFGSRFYSPTGAANSDGTARLTGTPTAIVMQTFLFSDDKPEHIEVDSGLYRLVGGLRGKIGSTWTWESAALYSRAQTTDRSENAIRESLVAASLARNDYSAYNPFGYTFKVANGAVVIDKSYENPKSVLDQFVREWKHDGFSSIGSVDLRASGQVVDLWAGPISAAFGGEFRKEEFVDYRPPYSGVNPASSGLDVNNNDFVTASPKPDSAGDRKVTSGYGELVIPLVAPKNQIPLVNSFEVSGSGRFERYSDFGNTTRPKVGVNYRPIPWVMIRGSFNEGFTAPNLPTLYAPVQFSVDTAPGTIDPYRNPVTTEGAYVQKSYSQGNLGLKPSTSIGKSAGIVVDVPWVKGLSFTADYWQIEQQGVITSLTSTQILNADSALLQAATQAQLNAGVSINNVDLGSGTGAYKGNPDVVRAPLTDDDRAVFAAYNAGKHASQQLAPVGRILSRTANFLNLASGYVSGWDFSANYNLPQMSIGRLTFQTDWSYLIRSYQTRNVPGAAPITQERLAVDGTTRWRGNATVTWRKGNWTANVGAYYIGRYTDSSGTTTAAVYNALGAPHYLSKTFDSGAYAYRYVVNDTLTYNATVGYRFKSESKFLKGVSLRGGIINITDKAPPLQSGAYGYSTSVYGQLVAGRTYTLEINKHF
jgi:outer membrane receptor protein involved in Fe transport